MQTTAKLRYLRMSPRKVRLVADVIRGRDVLDAQKQLEFMKKRAAHPMLKLLNSAMANAENNPEHSGLKRDNLYISELRVDEGPVLKRWKPRAMGRATPINKRTSHISIILDEKTAITESTEKTRGTQRKIQSSQGDSESSVLAGKVLKKEKKDKKKIDKDVTVVKSLDEVKRLEKKEEVPEKIEKPETQEHKGEIKDIRREGSDRHKQHLDTVRKKQKGGILKKMFRRKAI